MGEAQWSGSTGVLCVMEPLLVGLGGSRQAWWILRGLGWMLLERGQKVPVSSKLVVERMWDGDLYRLMGTLDVREKKGGAVCPDSCQTGGPRLESWMLQRKVV